MIIYKMPLIGERHQKGLVIGEVFGISCTIEVAMTYEQFADRYFSPPIKARFLRNLDSTYLFYHDTVFDTYNYLQNAFSWVRSPEGHTYWYHICSIIARGERA